MEVSDSSSWRVHPQRFRLRARRTAPQHSALSPLEWVLVQVIAQGGPHWDVEKFVLIAKKVTESATALGANYCSS